MGSEARRARLFRAGGAAEGDIADRVASRARPHTAHRRHNCRRGQGQFAFKRSLRRSSCRFPRHRAACRRQCNMALRGTAMAYTLVQAARVVARDQSTIWRAVKSGKLSGSRDPVSGGWLIEPVELFRFYGNPTPAAAATTPLHGDGTAQRGDATPYHDDATAELRARLADKDTVIEDLRRRLDRADEERRQMQARLEAEAEERRRLTLVLSDMRAATPAPQPAPRRRWWRWR